VIDCDDGDPCTIDECIDDACKHTQILAAVATARPTHRTYACPWSASKRVVHWSAKTGLPYYRLELENKVISAGGGCEGECSVINLVPPAHIKWNTPGIYEYAVICEDASATCFSEDAGRLILDYNCGCDPCECSSLCLSK